MLRFSVLLFLLAGWIGGAGAQAEEGGFPRIGVRDGHFIETGSGRTFVPLGVNYAHVAPLSTGKPGHATFSPGIYDPAYVETMMTDLSTWGMNTIRTFQIYDVGPGGILLSADARELSPAYLHNVLDFLQAARRHGIHVIFTWDTWNPASTWWADTPLPEEGNPFWPEYRPAARANNDYLSLRSARVRFNAILALIRAIRAADPDLLRVVMAWELQNEVSFDETAEPLKNRPPHFSYGGKTYDLGSDEGAQQFMDAALDQWCDLGVETIHRADPGSLVSVSVFAFQAVHRIGPGHLSEDRTPDRRVPGRPLALLRSHLDYVDLHLYAKTDGAPDAAAYAEDYQGQLRSLEDPPLQETAAQLGKPLLIGECGVFAKFFHAPFPDGPIDLNLGLQVIESHAARLKKSGFAGALYWEFGPNRLVYSSPALRKGSGSVR